MIVDEQHRFGVHQRLALREKGRHGGGHPHQLIMTRDADPAHPGDERLRRSRRLGDRRTAAGPHSR
ncbi:MAG: hypothetical protein MZV65_36380 [Chromatiales bacterium]|nr:hypothetical protein [Chromatiales bacterium]